MSHTPSTREVVRLADVSQRHADSRRIDEFNRQPWPVALQIGFFCMLIVAGWIIVGAVVLAAIAVIL